MIAHQHQCSIVREVVKHRAAVLKEQGQVVVVAQLADVHLPRQLVRDASVVNLARQVATLVEPPQLCVRRVATPGIGPRRCWAGHGALHGRATLLVHAGGVAAEAAVLGKELLRAAASGGAEGPANAGNARAYSRIRPGWKVICSRATI